MLLNDTQAADEAAAEAHEAAADAHEESSDASDGDDGSFF